MRIALVLITCFLTNVIMAQEIESIVGVAHAETGPTVRAVGNAGDAVEIIMNWLGSYATIQCNNKLQPTLKRNLVSTINKFKDSIPVGATVEFLVLTNKFKCEIIGMVKKTQTVRIKNGKCSIKDLELTQPAIIYDPVTTGFFSLTIKF